MSLTEWLATGAGALLVVGALREVFHTLLHPEGVGQLTPLIFRAVWRRGRRLGARALAVAGPVAVATTLVTWTSMLVVGWGLIYWPHLPEHFSVTSGVPASRQGGVLDAVYLSGVALSTLGFGDIVAVSTPLRLALVAEALIGFALLSASIGWVLSLYPALMRRRALCGRIAALLDDSAGEARIRSTEPPLATAVVLHGLAEQLSTVRVDLIQYPTSYFFEEPQPDLSLPNVLPHLRHALEPERLAPEARVGAEAVAAAIAGLARTLREGPYDLDAGADVDDTLAAFAADHRG